MPRVRRRGRVVRSHLTREQEIELLIGPNGASSFATEAERREAWEDHGPGLAEGWQAATKLWGFEQYGDSVLRRVSR